MSTASTRWVGASALAESRRSHGRCGPTPWTQMTTCGVGRIAPFVIHDAMEAMRREAAKLQSTRYGLRQHVLVRMGGAVWRRNSIVCGCAVRAPRGKSCNNPPSRSTPSTAMNHCRCLCSLFRRCTGGYVRVARLTRGQTSGDGIQRVSQDNPGAMLAAAPGWSRKCRGRCKPAPATTTTTISSTRLRSSTINGSARRAMAKALTAFFGAGYDRAINCVIAKLPAERN